MKKASATTAGKKPQGEEGRRPFVSQGKPSFLWVN